MPLALAEPVSMDPAWIESFREKLDQLHSWPTLYMFKFIVPKGKEEEVRSLFPLHIPSEKESKNGNYISLTLQMMMPSSKAVISVYQKVSAIEGIIAL
jgi:putative lipoic acid-binding regulatory protein